MLNDALQDREEDAAAPMAAIRVPSLCVVAMDELGAAARDPI